jgi:hypothetical protein
VPMRMILAPGVITPFAVRSFHTQQQQPDGTRHVVALGSDTRRLEINGFVKAGDETCGNGRRLFCGGGNCLIPEAFMQIGAALAQRREPLLELRLTMGLDAQSDIFPKQSANVAGLRLGQ